jgi:serine/threonine-protein kinase RsbW
MYDYGQGAFKVDMVVNLGPYPDVRHVRISSLTELFPLVERLEMRMRLLGYSRKDIFAAMFALVEVTTNAIRHGNRQDPTKHVLISYVMGPDEILIEVEDEGEGFDPACVPDPLAGENVGRPFGRGLFLARAYTSWLTFNSRGNRVTMCRRRSAP